VRSTAGLRRAGSAAIDLAYTACGRYDGFWEVGLSRWDVAAFEHRLTAQHVGDRTSCLADDQHPRGDVVAAGASLHACILERTREHFGASA